MSGATVGAVAPDLRRAALVMAVAALGGYAAEYAFNLGLTRSLEPHLYGDLKVAFAFAHFFGLAVLLGGDRAAPMVLVPFLDRGEALKVWAYLRFYLRCGASLAALLALVTWTVSYLHVGAADPEHHHPLAWIVVIVPINALGALVSRTLQSAHRPGQAALPWRIGLPVLQLAILWGFYQWKGGVGLVEAVCIAMGAATAMTLLQSWWVLRLGLVAVGAAPHDRSASEAWLSASLPMMGSFLVALALGQSDIYFLELLGDEAEVGHYAAADTAAHVILLVQTAVIGIVAPLVKPAIDAGAAASRAGFRRSERMMLFAATPVGIGLILAAGPILDTFGSQYRAASGVLVLLAVGKLVWAVAAVSSLWLQYQGRAGTVLGISIAALVLDAALNAVLIPRWGMMGAAAGTALVLALASLGAVVALRRAA